MTDREIIEQALPRIADWYADAGDAMAASYLQKIAPIPNRIVSYLVKRNFPTRS